MGHVNILPLKPLPAPFLGACPRASCLHLSQQEAPLHTTKNPGVEKPVPRSPFLSRHQDASSQFRAVVCPGPIIFEFVLCQAFWLHLHCLQELWLLHIQDGFLLEARPWRRGAHRRQRKGRQELCSMAFLRQPQPLSLAVSRQAQPKRKKRCPRCSSDA